MDTKINSNARMATITAVGLLAVGFSVQASAVDLQLRHPFKIPSERLDAALSAFSVETHVHVVTSGVPADALSPGVGGDLSTANALTALLRGTGMSFRQLDASTVVVVPARMAKLAPAQLRLVADVDQNALADQPTAGAAPAAAQPPGGLTEVQVTGTRIIREGYEAPTPVTAVGLAQLQDLAQANMGDALQEMPVFQGNVNFTNQNMSDTQASQTELVLRNLSASRTLVLFDGRRIPTANQENVPDLDLVPDALVQRVDVVTGGASAVYGSDAVAGVVNYVLDTNFTGLKGLVQGGISGYGDARSEKVSLTFGTTFGDGRVHFVFSADERYQEELPGAYRPWDTQQSGHSTINDPAFVTNKNTPQNLNEGCCTTEPGYYPGGLILAGPLQGTAFGVGGTPFQYNYGTNVNTPLGALPGIRTAGNGVYGGDWQLGTFNVDITAMAQVRHFFSRVGFDITPNLQVFAEWLDGADHTRDQCCNNYYPTGVGTLYTNNPYLPASVATQAQTLGVTSFTLGDTINTLNGGLLLNGSTGIPVCVCVNDFRYTDAYVIGLKGQFTLGKNSYNWNVYGQQGTNVEQFAIGFQSIKTNLSDAIEAVKVGTYSGTTSYTQPQTLGGLTIAAPYTAANFPNPLGIPSGTITCASNLLPRNNPSATSDCVPFNVFGLGVASQAAINYTMGRATQRQVGEQNMIGGSITGEPFSDWAGPISLALDVEYRHEAEGGFSDPISAVTGFFSGNFFSYFASQYVTEGALETVVPLLKDKPFVQALDFNAAARATDYSTSGYVTTYKLGLEYTPINDVRVRATFSEDIRAPNLFNLDGYTLGHGSTNDPFTNTTSPSYSITTGNPNLRAEKAHQYELGLVLQPSEIPGLNLSIDYFHIEIAEAIAAIPSPLNQCFGTRIGNTLNGTSPYCSLVKRNADGSLYSVTSYSINEAAFLASGVDYEGDYRKNLTEWVPSWKGTFDLHITATNTMHDITNTGIPGPNQILDATGSGNVPRWAVFGTLSYDLDRWHFSWTERYDSSVLASNTTIVCSTNCPNPIPTGFSTLDVVPRVPTYFLANMSVSYKFMEHDQQEATAFINANNVFNKIPPFNYGHPVGYGVPTNQTLYDSLGLYVTAGLRFRL